MKNNRCPKKPKFNPPPASPVNKTLYLVGRWLDDKGETWEVQGIYESVENAEKACMNYLWFVMPVEKNIALSMDSEIVGYFPNKTPQETDN